MSSKRKLCFSPPPAVSSSSLQLRLRRFVNAGRGGGGERDEESDGASSERNAGERRGEEKETNGVETRWKKRIAECTSKLQVISSDEEEKKEGSNSNSGNGLVNNNDSDNSGNKNEEKSEVTKIFCMGVMGWNAHGDTAIQMSSSFEVKNADMKRTSHNFLDTSDDDKDKEENAKTLSSKSQKKENKNVKKLQKYEMVTLILNEAKKEMCLCIQNTMKEKKGKHEKKERKKQAVKQTDGEKEGDEVETLSSTNGEDKTNGSENDGASDGELQSVKAQQKRKEKEEVEETAQYTCMFDWMPIHELRYYAHVSKRLVHNSKGDNNTSNNNNNSKENCKNFLPFIFFDFGLRDVCFYNSCPDGTRSNDSHNNNNKGNGHNTNGNHSHSDDAEEKRRKKHRRIAPDDENEEEKKTNEKQVTIVKVKYLLISFLRTRNIDHIARIFRKIDMFLKEVNRKKMALDLILYKSDTFLSFKQRMGAHFDNNSINNNNTCNNNNNEDNNTLINKKADKYGACFSKQNSGVSFRSFFYKFYGRCRELEEKIYARSEEYDGYMVDCLSSFSSSSLSSFSLSSQRKVKADCLTSNETEKVGVPSGNIQANKEELTSQSNNETEKDECKDKRERGESEKTSSGDGKGWTIDNVFLDKNCLERLEGNLFLDDSIVDFFNLFIFKYILTDVQRSNWLIMNTFFFQKLLQFDCVKSAYTQLSRWTKKLKVSFCFKKKLIFFPVNLCGAHWSLILVYFPKKRKKIIKLNNYTENVLCVCASDSNNGNNDICYCCCSKYVKNENKNKNKYIDYEGNESVSSSAFSPTTPSVLPSSSTFSPSSSSWRRSPASAASQRSLADENADTEKAYIMYMDSLSSSYVPLKKIKVLQEYLSHEFESEYEEEMEAEGRNNYDRMHCIHHRYHTHSHRQKNQSNNNNDEKKKKKLVFEVVRNVRVPQQANGYDCGVFIIEYILYIALNESKFFNQVFDENNNPEEEENEEEAAGEEDEKEKKKTIYDSVESEEERDRECCCCCCCRRRKLKSKQVSICNNNYAYTNVDVIIDNNNNHNEDISGEAEAGRSIETIKTNEKRNSKKGGIGYMSLRSRKKRILSRWFTQKHVTFRRRIMCRMLLYMLENSFWTQDESSVKSLVNLFTQSPSLPSCDDSDSEKESEGPLRRLLRGNLVNGRRKRAQSSDEEYKVNIHKRKPSPSPNSVLCNSNNKAFLPSSTRVASSCFSSSASAVLHSISSSTPQDSLLKIRRKRRVASDRSSSSDCPRYSPPPPASPSLRTRTSPRLRSLDTPVQSPPVSRLERSYPQTTLPSLSSPPALYSSPKPPSVRYADFQKRCFMKKQNILNKKENEDDEDTKDDNEVIEENR